MSISDAFDDNRDFVIHVPEIGFVDCVVRPLGHVDHGVHLELVSAVDDRGERIDGETWQLIRHMLQLA